VALTFPAPVGANATSYVLCAYETRGGEAPVLISSFAPAGWCDGQSCWFERASGTGDWRFAYRSDAGDKSRFRFRSGRAPLIQIKGSSSTGGTFQLPDSLALSGKVDVQLQEIGSATCWGALYDPAAGKVKASLRSYGGKS
jgi:hypothetical protein